MPTNKIVTINGRTYDAVTGLPVTVPKPAKVASKSAAKPAATARTTKASEVHATTQRSKTLHRRATKKPTGGRSMDIAPVTKPQRFAPHPTPKPVTRPTPVAAPAPKKVVQRDSPMRPAQVHPVAARALQRTAPAKAVAKPTTAKQVKEAALAKALAAPKAPVAKKSIRKNPWVKRLIIIGSIIIAIGLVLFAIYRFVPAVTVGIASAQAGVQASYPEFVPDGYHLSHPVTFSDGEVRLDFTSNSNDTSYSITQTNSSWDSSAVLDKVVRPEAGENYVITRERGLTLYSYKTSAAWVNGGILYVIDSKAPLSGEQIRRIATSL